nr:hypothetical protein [Tanacetum cinerariifolium]
MSCVLRCSWCGGSFNGRNRWRSTNVSFEDKFVRYPDPISYDETLDFLTHLHIPRHTCVTYVGTIITMVMIVHHGYRLSMSRNRAIIKTLCQPRKQNSYDPNLCYNYNSFGFDQPPQYSIDYQEDLNQQMTNDVDDRWNKMIESGNKLMQFLGELIFQREQAANLKSTIPLNEIVSQIPSSIAITPVLPTMDPEDSLIMENEELSTIPEKESDEVIKFSVEDFVPIPSEFEDTFGGD